MPDHLTPAERDAIQRYTGPIRVIPRGVSGIPEYGMAIPMASQIKSCFDRGKRIKAAANRRNEERRAGLPPMQELPGEKRDDTIRRMVGEGHTQADVARFYGVSRAAITQRLKRKQ